MALLDSVVLAGQTAEDGLELAVGQVQRRLQGGPVCAGRHIVKIQRLAGDQRHVGAVAKEVCVVNNESLLGEVPIVRGRIPGSGLYPEAVAAVRHNAAAQLVPGGELDAQNRVVRGVADRAVNQSRRSRQRKTDVGYAAAGDRDTGSGRVKIARCGGRSCA